MKLFILPLVLTLAACNSNTSVKEVKQSMETSSKSLFSEVLSYQIDKDRVAVGETIELTFKAQENSQDVQVQFSTSPDMQLTGKQLFHFQKSNVNEHSIQVTPMTEGIHYIVVTLGDPNVTKQKPQSIRIIAGDKPVEEYFEKMGTVTEINGEKVIIMKGDN